MTGLPEYQKKPQQGNAAPPFEMQLATFSQPPHQVPISFSQPVSPRQQTTGQQPTEQAVATGLVPITVNGKTFYVQEPPTDKQSPIQDPERRKRRRKQIIFGAVIATILVLAVIIIPIAVVLSQDDDYDGEITSASALYYSTSSGYRTTFGYYVKNTGKKNAYFSVEVWDGSEFLGWDWDFIYVGQEEYEDVRNVFEYYRAGMYELRLKAHPSEDVYDDGKLVDTYSVTSTAL
eukprot:TRINITY_DN4112_c0_g1_i4.p2 TRINITY_DN4112_c0_g1~~TRINITY_DN4112_c0_g1_i4.p2  ORF type:complete len:233 (-),score=30.94 TRINITY_DN4112_c0_g1_i4:1105-1803(-)